MLLCAMAVTDLPEDVMVNFLTWLPVKSLIRFTSVSKQWRFIILSGIPIQRSSSAGNPRSPTHILRCPSTRIPKLG
ncbi:hypothetical protein ACLB2K_026574 [Fragaria x ananassa]